MVWFKWLVRGIVVFVLASAIGVYAACQYGNGAVADYLTQVLGDATGVAARMDSVDVAPFAGTVRLNGLSIPNAEGFADTDGTTNFCSLGTAELAVHPLKLRHDKLFIPRIAIDHMEVLLQTKDAQANFDPLLQAIKAHAVPIREFSARRSATAAGATADAGSGGATAGAELIAPVEFEGKRYVVGEVIIRDMVVTAETYVLGEVSQRIVLRVPAVKLSNIGRGTPNGVDSHQLTAAILEGVCRHIYATGSQHLPDNMASRFISSLRQLGRISEFESTRIGDQAEVLESGNDRTLPIG